MKKYLMTGIAALALCAGFTSCSHDSEGFASLQDVSKSKYQDAFVNRYGEIDRNQDWGFGTTRTRAINVNGNLWKETPECTAAEQKLVFDYVNMTKAQMTAANHKYTEKFPKNIQNYFVTQVYTGTDTYDTADGTTKDILGSSKMNHLVIAMNSGSAIVDGALNDEGAWTHINNFNASSNMNYGGNTLVVDGGTYDFAYICSEDSRYHNKWIAVNGADVDASLAGKYYICFDFIAENPQAQTAWRAKFWNPEGNNGGEWQEKNFTINGYYPLDDLKNLSFTVELWSVTQNKNIEYTYTLGDTSKVKDLSIDNLVGGNKVIPANDVYTDWIVRIVEAEEEKEEIPYAGRIICEDLGGSDDFDFNDVVFSAYIDAQNNKTYIKLEAAGGTLPLTVAGVEVHDKFAEENPNAGITRKTMINTGKGPQVAPVEFVVNQAFTSYNAIPVVVTMDAALYGGGTGEELIELKAEMGKAPQKIMVTSDYVICSERQQIESKYTNFPAWVKDSSVKWY